MPLQTVAHDDSEVIYQALHDDGAVVVRDLFATKAIERIADDISQALDPLPWCNSEEEGYGKKFFGHGELQQDVHTDAGSWHKANLPGELLFSMTIALTDFTKANGATVVAPGSHRWPSAREHTQADFTDAEMEVGSALCCSGIVRHGGGANRTEATRVGLYLGYVPFWLQPLENAVTTHPAGFLDQLDADAQSFLGYHPSGFQAVLGQGASDQVSHTQRV